MGYPVPTMTPAPRRPARAPRAKRVPAAQVRRVAPRAVVTVPRRPAPLPAGVPVQLGELEGLSLKGIGRKLSKGVKKLVHNPGQWAKSVTKQYAAPTVAIAAAGLTGGALAPLAGGVVGKLTNSAVGKVVGGTAQKIARIQRTAKGVATALKGPASRSYGMPNVGVASPSLANLGTGLPPAAVKIATAVQRAGDAVKATADRAAVRATGVQSALAHFATEAEKIANAATAAGVPGVANLAQQVSSAADSLADSAGTAAGALPYIGAAADGAATGAVAGAAGGVATKSIGDTIKANAVPLALGLAGVGVVVSLARGGGRAREWR